jgi:two-component system cell cycle response regulator
MDWVPRPPRRQVGGSARGNLSDTAASRQWEPLAIPGRIDKPRQGTSRLKLRARGADTATMADGQDRMPAGAKVATGVIVAALGLLLAHNAFKVAWPGVLPTSWWSWLYNAIEFAAAGLCGLRCLVRKRERGAWIAIGIGILSFSAGDLYWSITLNSGISISYPSFADAGYLGFYPAVYVGIALLLRSRFSEIPAGLGLDGIIGALAVAAVGAVVAFGAVLSDTHGAPLTVATNLSYPLADLLLLGIVAGVMALAGPRSSRSWLPIALGLIVFAITDSIYLIETANNTYVQNGLLDVGWPTALLLIALASWGRAPRARRIRMRTWAMFVLPSGAAVACLALEFYDHYHRIALVAEVLCTTCLLLVIVRLGLSFAENLRMLRGSRREAFTDALTGLGNRRAVKRELEARLAQDPIEPFVLAYYDLDGFKDYNDAFGHQAGDALLTRLGDRIRQALPEADVFRMGGDEFCVIASESDGGAQVAVRAAAALSEQGTGFSVGCSFGLVHVPGEATDSDGAMVQADARMYHQKGQRRPSAAAESQGVLLRALAERNRELGQHNDDVAELVQAVSAELGLSPAEIVPIRCAAELHDVGKLAIPDEILNKPGPLDVHEWSFMHRHTIVGERIVASATSLRDVAPIVRASHERWDGAGYPDATAGEAIPLGARIIAVCDAYDAMITTRPYRAAMSEDAALRELRRCSGAQFDPHVVAAFERVLARQADLEAAQAGPGADARADEADELATA